MSQANHLAKEINNKYPKTQCKPYLYRKSYGRKKSLQDIILLLAKDCKNYGLEDLAIYTWMRETLDREALIGITRHNPIPYLPIYIRDREHSLDFFNLAKAIGETANITVRPENHNQICWLLTLKFYQQAKGVCLAHQLFPQVIEDPLSEKGILSRHLPSSSLENLKLSTEMNLCCYLLIEKGFSLIKNKAETEQKTFPWSNTTELFLQIQQEKFENGWLFGPMNKDPQWLTKHRQRENISAEIRILEHKDWTEDSSTNHNQSELIPLRRLSYPEAEQEYLHDLKNRGWSGYWIYALRQQYVELLKECDYSKPKLKKLENQHPLGWLITLWPKYLKAWKNSKEKLFVKDFIWIKGNPSKSYSTSKTRQVQAFYDINGYIDWVWGC